MVAERGGFEPPRRVKTAYTISSRAPSASSDTSPRQRAIIPEHSRARRFPGFARHRHRRRLPRPWAALWQRPPDRRPLRQDGPWEMARVTGSRVSSPREAPQPNAGQDNAAEQPQEELLAHHSHEEDEHTVGGHEPAP